MPEYILPVPLHPQREFQRGFNQSQLLSELIAKALKIPCQSDWVLRRQNTPSQMQLNIKDRKKNMKDAFQAGPGIQVSRHIALFDDVMTTGATLSSIATVLKRAGAKRVDFWSLARTPK